jgi:hypothetical protein
VLVQKYVEPFPRNSCDQCLGFSAKRWNFIANNKNSHDNTCKLVFFFYLRGLLGIEFCAAYYEILELSPGICNAHAYLLL